MRYFMCNFMSIYFAKNIINLIFFIRPYKVNYCWGRSINLTRKVFFWRLYVSWFILFLVWSSMFNYKEIYIKILYLKFQFQKSNLFNNRVIIYLLNFQTLNLFPPSSISLFSLFITLSTHPTLSIFWLRFAQRRLVARSEALLLFVQLQCITALQQVSTAPMSSGALLWTYSCVAVPCSEPYL